MNRERYDARLRLLPCVVCVLLDERPPNPCHHLHHLGPAEERDDDCKVPICDPHHEGPEGVHGLRRRGFVKKYLITDLKMLSTTQRLFRETLP